MNGGFRDDTECVFGGSLAPNTLFFLRSKCVFDSQGRYAVDVFCRVRLRRLDNRTSQTILEAQLIRQKVLNCIFGVRALFSARLETDSFDCGLARNAPRVSSAIRRNLRRKFAQLGRKSAQPSAISTTAQILATTLAPSRWLPETFRAPFFPNNTNFCIN